MAAMSTVDVHGEPVVGKAPGDRDELARLGDAFADASRRHLFRRVMAAPVPLSAGELACTTGLHRTVARAHLEKLVELGLLSVHPRHTGRGGRPARVFSPAGTVTTLSLPARRYEWLARGLLSVLPAGAGDGATLAAAVEETGARDGRAIGATSVQAAVAWLELHGYRAALDDGADGPVLELRNCVVAELAAMAPGIVCGYDRGFVRGLLDLPARGLEQIGSILDGSDVCRLRLRR